VRADRIVTSVAVVDDHPIVREGIVATLADSGDFRIAGTAAPLATRSRSQSASGRT
jgi:DNA-binding NarL/FixJ family response regulator